MRNQRFACARVRNFALELWLARPPGKRAGPVVVADRPGDTAVIRQCNGEALHAGIKPGMTAAQANSLCADLRVISLLDLPVQAESKRLLAHLQNLSPQVEARAPGTYLLGASGLARLYGSEANFARTVIATVRSHGLPVTVGVGDTGTAARIAAEVSAPGTFTVIPAGRAQHFLGPLAVDVLEPTPRAAEQLKALGLQTIAQIATIPATELVRRFGPEGRLLRDLSCGREGPPFAPAALPRDRSRTASFAFSLTRVAAVVAQLERLTGELFGRLSAWGGAAAALHVEMQLEDGTRERLALAVSRPMASATPFLLQLRERLHKMHFTAGVIGLSVVLGGVTRAGARQLELRRPERLSKSPADNRSGSSPSAVVPVAIPRLVASHLPEESFALVTPFGKRARHGVPSGAHRPAYASESLAGLRLLAPPCRTTVGEQHGVPQTVRLEARTRNILSRRGPWELSGRWWGDAFDRRYFEVETEGAESYLLFFDRGSAQWYLQGVFD